MANSREAVLSLTWEGRRRKTEENSLAGVGMYEEVGERGRDDGMEKQILISRMQRKQRNGFPYTYNATSMAVYKSMCSSRCNANQMMYLSCGVDRYDSYK